LILIWVLSAGPANAASGSAQWASGGDPSAIERALRHASRGSTVIVEAGRYKISKLAVPAGITLYAPKGASIIGNMTAHGPGTVIRGFTLEAGMIDLSNSRSVTVGDCTFNGGTTSIKLDDAGDALIINNDFRQVSGGVVTGWGLDRSTISGNHFFDCGQCINLAFNNNRTQGRDIVIERNIFNGVARMPVEVGPIGAYTENLIVRDNWAENFKNRGPDAGDTMSTFVAYSLVPTNGVNTLVSGNYAIAGDRGAGDIGIELAGSGEISDNHIEDFRYGAIVYGADFYVHGNRFLNTTEAIVLNYAKLSGRIVHDEPTLRLTTPPGRRSWP
jgi:hypothetical protein